MLPVGLLRLATVIKVDTSSGIIDANLDFSNVTVQSNTSRKIQIPFAHYSNEGLFIGGYPDPGTQIVVGQGEGGKWYFVSFYSTAFYQKSGSTPPKLNPGELLLQASDSTKITLNSSGEVIIGSNLARTYLSTDSKLLINNFSQSLLFTEASREVTGPIKRDLHPKEKLSANSKLDSPLLDKYLNYIGLDPKTSVTFSSVGNSKNPPFAEKRELVYEFIQSSNVADDISESSLYGLSSQQNTQYLFPNRRKSRADTLSLTLAAPNFLMETVKGTVVDIFGNILDINRSKLDIGNENLTISSTGNKDKVETYNKIRELHRRSIAYHFEINARKDLTGNSGKAKLPDINSNEDYARSRSRFFIDIDKEGLLKANIPASSETGNIPLLTRYENYSTFSPEDGGNPNKLISIDSNLDIFLDSFAIGADGKGGVIDIVDKDGVSSPMDRITNSHIKHGTAYHNILDTCKVHQSSDSISYLYEPLVDPETIPIVKEIVSPKIIIGENAGGRSGSINFDGSLELNVGANTVDRQSLWLDTAGGMVANIGRDKNDISAAISMDGDLLLQVGGSGIIGDSRFNAVNNANRSGAIDIRVFNASDGLGCTLIRIDKEGIKILTPGNMVFQSTGDMMFRAKKMAFDAESIAIHDRQVMKYSPSSI